MSKRAIAYVQSRRLADPDAARVFLLLAERTQASSFADELAPMGLLLADTDLSGIAAELGINADRFRNVLRQLRDLVPMDVLEHSDGVWEIVYGPGYTDPLPLPARAREAVGFRNVFAMPGWESYSTWGRDEPLGLSGHAYLYAQLYRDSDNPDGAPRIWITPPKYVLATLDQLAEAIATEIAPYEPIPLPPALIRGWMVQRAGVSLATLYRYFPSKNHVLLAISYSRYEDALRRVTNEAPHGATVQERVTSHLLREFRAEQRDQKLTAALTRVITDTRREYSQLVRQILELHIQVLRQVAVAGGPISDEQDRRLRIVVDVFGAATRRWLAGVSSAAEARFEIRIGCQLLNTAHLFPSGIPAEP